MRQKVLDTSVLLTHWRNRCGNSLERITRKDAEKFARELIALRRSDCIVTPVFLEMVCGTRSKHELDVTHAYLDQFKILDKGKVLPQDWEEARRIGERVPRDGKRRQLGDCLIRAIARRFGFDVDTSDRGFP
jgi:predicted nucleic acid-binding protein